MSPETVTVGELRERLPDAGFATLTDMEACARRIAEATVAPLIADTGYGGLLNVAHTVRRYEAAGVAAIQLEDQEFPKECGHTPGRVVTPRAEMAKRVAVVAEARGDPNMLILVRTAHGLDGALGFLLAIYLATGFLAAAAALESTYGALKRDGSSTNAGPLKDFQAFNEALGFRDVWEFDEKWGEP